MELTKENVLNALKHCLKDYKSDWRNRLTV